MDEKKLDQKEFEELGRHLVYEEKKDILEFRRYWSPRIFWLLVSILIFQAGFVVVIGLGWLDFVEYENVVSVYLAESVIQIVGLSVIVLKFLFPNKDNNEKN